jgi:hypothetical protein
VLLPRQRSKLARGAKDKEHAMSQNSNTSIAIVGIDIGKNSFHLVGLYQRGAIVLRQKWSRGQVEARFANMPSCLIGMEACVGAHHLSRRLKALGHDARLMPARYVRPYSKGQKNDFRDAEAIGEAVQRPTMKFVATKTADQLDLQALHRVRERLVSQRTGIINQIRAFLLERGIAVRQGLRFLRAELPRILSTPPEVLSPRMVGLPIQRDDASTAASRLRKLFYFNRLPIIALYENFFGAHPLTLPKVCPNRTPITGRRGSTVIFVAHWQKQRGCEHDKGVCRSIRRVIQSAKGARRALNERLAARSDDQPRTVSTNQRVPAG